MSSKYHKNRHAPKFVPRKKLNLVEQPPQVYRDLFNIGEVFYLVLLAFAVMAYIARVL